jgi:nucleotide-binding universal stress UspA family protein
MTTSGRTPTILAVVDEHGSAAVRRRAIELAKGAGADLILWDVEAGRRLLEDPLPNDWSADGAEEQFGDRLSVDDLEAAGRAPLARHVAEARAAGVGAWGWLPSDQTADTLRDYAARQGADLVVVGADSPIDGDLADAGLRIEVVAAPG